MRPFFRRTLIPIGWLLWSANAFAEESAADKAAADALFSEGRKLMKAGSIDEACPKFAESYRRSARVGTLLNLATCHEKQGKTASAWAEYNEVAALAKRDKRKDREEYAKSRAKELEPELARVTFSVPATIKNAKLELDGKEIAPSVWGTPLPVDPGKHSVVVSAPGKKSWSNDFEIKTRSGTTKIEAPELGSEETTPASTPSEKSASPDSATQPEPDEPKPQTKSGGNALGWVALGVGVVGVGVGSYFGLRTISKNDESEDHCGSAIGASSQNDCDQQGVDLRDQAKSAGTLSTIGFAVGAVGIGAGVVLLLTSGSKREARTHRPLIAPVVERHGAGLILKTRL